MSNLPADFVPNGTRKIRGSRPDGIAMPSKGNRNSSYLGSARPTPDETARFGEVYPFTNLVKPYVPTPVPGPAIWGGVSAGSPRSTRPAPKPRTVRTPPPAGRRPSLAAMRAKG